MKKRQKLRDEKFAQLALSKKSNQLANRLDPVDEKLNSQKEQIKKLTESTRKLYELVGESQLPLGAQSGFAGD
jgi:hypothetical protein